MDSVVYDKMKGAESDLQELESVKLKSCADVTDTKIGNYSSAWYEDEDPYDVAVVEVTFDIQYKNGSGGGFSNGEYHWWYYLVKENKDSPWIIVMWGV